MNAPRFCPTCGQPLTPAPICPRCGTNVAAALGYQRRSGGLHPAIIVLIVFLGAIPILGILAAIAIPNFIRYQLRAKQSEAPLVLKALARAEQAQLQRSGKYVPIAGIPAAEPSSQKTALTAEERQAANELDWVVEGSLYGQYRVAVQERDGVQAASLCAEQDLDGDGNRAVFVYFLPRPDGGAPPPAPCTEPVRWSSDYALGEPVKVTEHNVF